MSAEIGTNQTWVIADELASLGHQPQIEKLLTRGRKRGVAVTIGLQSTRLPRRGQSHHAR